MTSVAPLTGLILWAQGFAGADAIGIAAIFGAFIWAILKMVRAQNREDE